MYDYITETLRQKRCSLYGIFCVIVPAAWASCYRGSGIGFSRLGHLVPTARASGDQKTAAMAVLRKDLFGYKKRAISNVQKIT